MKQEYVLLLMLVLVIFYFYSIRPPKGVEKVDMEGLRALKAQGGRILDVRTPEEFREGHIPGAKNHPLGSKEFFAGLPKDKDTPIAVYCRSGKRAATAERQLLKRGYTKVYDFGGIHRWKGDLE